MQNHSGGDSVASGIVFPLLLMNLSPRQYLVFPLLLMNLSPRQYLMGDNSASNKFNPNEAICTRRGYKRAEASVGRVQTNYTFR